MVISAIQRKIKQDKGLEIGDGGKGELFYIGWSW